MTIQLFQTFNGIPAGVHTLEGAEEIRLIGLGLARAWEPSIDGVSFQDSDNILLTPAQVAAANAAGRPVPGGTLLADPTTGLIYGQSDGAGGYREIGALGHAESRQWVPHDFTDNYGTAVPLLEARTASLVPDGQSRVGMTFAYGNGESWNDIPIGATVPVTASIAGTVMTVTAVGVAASPNGSTSAGVVKRGHFVTGSGSIPADTYITSRGTGTGNTGTYNLSADCGTVSSTSLALNCSDGIGGCVARVTSSFVGSASSVDAASTKAWRLTIDPTHAVTVGHGRTMLGGPPMPLRQTYRVESMFRMHDEVNGAWQKSDSTIAMPLMSVFLLEQVSEPQFYDQDGSMGYGVQYINNGPFAVLYDRGELRWQIRTPRDDYAVLAGDGYWSWDMNDRWTQFGTSCTRYAMRGTDPVTLVAEFHLDERQRSEGGQGWLKVWLNNELWCDFVGPTAFPAGRETGQIGTVSMRMGMYDLTYDTVAAGTLCSAVRSTAIARSMDIKHFRIKRGV